jgi:hypothetical protein
MSRARTTWIPLPAIVPPLLALALLGAGLAGLRGAPMPGTLAAAAGVTLLRPRPAVWAAALLGLFGLGAAAILLSGAGLPANAVSLAFLAAGLAALAAWQHAWARRRWRSALDAFALRQIDAERPVGQAFEPDRSGSKA